MDPEDHPDRVPPNSHRIKLLRYEGNKGKWSVKLEGLENRKNQPAKLHSNKYDALREAGYVIGLCPVIN